MTGKYSNQDFLKIYIDTLDELRKNGRLFSQQNPDLAPFLDFSYRKSNDPETERLIESFAYMKAQVDYKSFLAKSDYAINFIDHIFPELVSPIPGMTILKIQPAKSFFKKDKYQFKIDKDTLFFSKNVDDEECLFSATQDTNISCCEVKNYRYIDVNTSKEDIYGFKKAFVFDIESSLPIENFQNINLSIFIDSEFQSVISILDTLLLSKSPIFIFKDEEAIPIKLSRESLKLIYQFNGHYDQCEENLLHPLFDFINFYQKYLFFKIDINIPINILKKIKFIIPIDDDFSGSFRTDNVFFRLNCVPILNVFEKKLVPIKYNDTQNEHRMRVDNDQKNNIEVLRVNKVVAYSSVSGKALEIPNFHKKIHRNSNDSSGYFWATKRTFNNTTSENGCLYLKLLNSDKDLHLKSEVPDYIFPSGLCTNSHLVEGIKPNSIFNCNVYDLPIEKSMSLIWPKYSRKPLDLNENTEVVKLLYKINQDLLSRNALNNYDFRKIIEILSSGQSPIKILFQQMLNQSTGFEAEETLSQQVWKNQSYYVPGILYKFQFSKMTGFPLGTYFLMSFLNSYFNYIRDFNFYIVFKAEKV
ncbi:type VI secretion system baseplate subunit TssF [Fluviispira multicolorata]|uniref:Type VI secretion system protein ImpG n=1 Tax=Fluviispira multicolorata TaxID=2654512 RepID=A0A833JDH0_9BACT|nr:type VI secretion system baseplate subunit TssF [Fluviispira multicolorata]KAB8031908.1 hypothetical protein GCL57_04490 [Fluviispira multicolorata]